MNGTLFREVEDEDFEEDEESESRVAESRLAGDKASKPNEQPVSWDRGCNH